MTFQLICIVVNAILVGVIISKSRQNARTAAHLNKVSKQLKAEYENLQSIHTDINKHGKSIHLKIGLDEIDIDRVKDAETRNYLATRRLITTFNPN